MSGLPQPIPLRLMPLTAEAFKPFGQVIEAPAMPNERRVYTRWLGSERRGMTPRLHVNRVNETLLPYLIEKLERHPHSAQIFFPVDVLRYILVVAPAADDGFPQVSAARAFVVPGDLGVVYASGLWHAGVTVLDRPASFSVLMWRNDSNDDEEFFQLASPLQVEG